MKRIMIHSTMLVILLFYAGCKSSESTDPVSPWDPQVDPADFVTNFSNPNFPITPGRTMVYYGQSDGETDSIEVTATLETKTVMGIQCAVVEFRQWIDRELVEVAEDWYAQDNSGTIWYFGEFVENYENGVIINNDGSWEAGVDDALPGIVMKASPQVGDEYYQEYYEGEAEDQAEVLSITASLTVPYGAYSNCIKTKDWTDLEPLAIENKYYAAGIGEIKSEHTDGSGSEELVAIRNE